MATNKITADLLLAKDAQQRIDALHKSLVIVKEAITSVKVEAKEMANSLKGMQFGNINLKDISSAKNNMQKTERDLLKLEQDRLILQQQIEKAQQQILRTKQQASKAEAESLKNKKLEIDIDTKQYNLAQKRAKEQEKQTKAKQKEIDKEKELTEALKLQGNTILELERKQKALTIARKNANINSKEYKQMTVELANVNSSIAKNNKSIGKFTDNVGNYMGAVKNFFAAAGISIGISAAFSAIQNFVGGSIKAFREFEKSMSELKAITGAGAKDLLFYGNAAKELSSKSTVAATDVVKAFTLIGSAKPELLKSASALTDVADKAIVLSEAAGMSLPDAAAALTDSMNQFSAPADQAGRYINVLAAGAKEGAASITASKDALLGFGSVASGANVNIEESVALIQTLADKGIKGAEAGTALRNVLLKLSAPDALGKDAQDAMKKLGVNMGVVSDKTLPINVRLKEMSKIMGDTYAMTKVFGTENITAGNIILQNIPRFEQLTKAVTGTNEAYKQQADMTDNLDGKLKKIGNQYDTLKISMGEVFAQMLNDIGILDGLTESLAFQNMVLQEKTIPAWRKFFGILRSEDYALLINKEISKMRQQSADIAVGLMEDIIKIKAQIKNLPADTDVGIRKEMAQKLADATINYQKYIDYKRETFKLTDAQLKLTEQEILKQALNNVMIEKQTDALNNNTNAIGKNNEAKKKGKTITSEGKLGEGTKPVEGTPQEIISLEGRKIPMMPRKQNVDWDLRIQPKIEEILPISEEDRMSIRQIIEEGLNQTLDIGSQTTDLFSSIYDFKAEQLDQDIEQTETEINNSQSRIDQLNSELEEKQNALQKELELGQTGAANNADKLRQEVALKQAEVQAETQKQNDLKKQKAKEEAERKKIGEKQKSWAKAGLTIDYFSELASHAKTSAANPLNIVTAGAAGIAQYALLAALSTGRFTLGLAQINATKYAHGGTGILEGERHINGGVNLGAIGEGEQGERFSIFSREATSKHGDMIEDFTNAANSNQLQDWYINTGFDKPFIANHYIDMTTKELEKKVTKMVEQQVLTNYYLKNQKTVLNNGKLIINSDNSREVFVG